jgi:hypothetical protein
MPLPVLAIAGIGAGLGALGGFFGWLGEKKRAEETKRQIEREMARRRETFERGRREISGTLETLSGLTQAEVARLASAGAELRRAYARAGEELRTGVGSLARETRGRTRELGEEYLRGVKTDIEEARRRVEDVYAGAKETARTLASEEVARQLDVLGVGALGGARALIASRMMQEAVLPILTEEARAKTGLEEQALALQQATRAGIFETTTGLEQLLFRSQAEALQSALQLGLTGLEREEQLRQLGFGLQQQLLGTQLQTQFGLMQTEIGLREGLPFVSGPNIWSVLGGMFSGAASGFLGGAQIAMATGGGGGGRGGMSRGTAGVGQEIPWAGTPGLETGSAFA